MQLTITGKNLEITDSLRKYVEKKIGRLDRYLPNIQDARVEL
jgi:putative sigma-54 modulation protein